MNHLDIDSACVIGYSYGAMVAQLMAVKHPERVTGLVCLQGSNYNPDLPGRTPDVEIAMIGAATEYATIEEQNEAIKRLRIATNGSVYGLDEDEALQSAHTSVQRMYYPQGTARIVLSRLATPPFFEETSAITCPTLILHADEDPIFNLEHGKDMARRIANANLILLEGAGHNHPKSLQPVIAKHLVGFAATLSGDPI
jgi:pimeloyl-ACP methyl ester carboxylesterase